MSLRPIVFSDIDFTIAFDSLLHPRTAELIDKVRLRADFILVTARSYEECAPLPPIPNDGIVTENGAGIFDRVDGRDVLCESWDRHVAVRQPVLDRYRDMLEADGWLIHHKPRAFSSCIDKSGKTQAELDEVVAALPEGLQLQFSHNTAGRYIEVFPLEAGKDKAIRQLCAQRGLPLQMTFAMGDNTNDIDMLRVVKMGFAPGNCHPQVREVLADLGGYVSPLDGHDGAADMLRRLLNELEGRQ